MESQRTQARWINFWRKKTDALKILFCSGLAYLLIFFCLKNIENDDFSWNLFCHFPRNNFCFGIIIRLILLFIESYPQIFNDTPLLFPRIFLQIPWAKVVPCSIKKVSRSPWRGTGPTRYTSDFDFLFFCFAFGWLLNRVVYSHFKMKN